MARFKEKLRDKKFLVRIIIFVTVILASIGYLYWNMFREVVNLLVASCLLAYILRPLRDLIKGKRNISKKISTLIVIVMIIILFILLLVLGVPKLIGELSSTTSVIEEIIDYLSSFKMKFNIENSAIFGTLYNEIEAEVWGILMSLSEGVINGLANFLENVIAFAVVPVVAYYILSDGDNISNKISLIIPMEKRRLTKIIAKDINLVLERYIVSQVVLSITTGIMCFLCFWILDLKFSIWLAIINGIFNIVPYFGAFFGGVPAILIAFLQSPTKGIWCIVSIIIIQQIEGNLLAPKITSESTDMHPIIIIILLLIGERVGGILGMVIIIPIGVIVKVIYDDINYYLF